MTDTQANATQPEIPTRRLRDGEVSALDVARVRTVLSELNDEKLRSAVLGYKVQNLEARLKRALTDLGYERECFTSDCATALLSEIVWDQEAPHIPSGHTWEWVYDGHYGDELMFPAVLKGSVEVPLGLTGGSVEVLWTGRLVDVTQGEDGNLTARYLISERAN